jgi:uncharacterized membrane protein
MLYFGIGGMLAAIHVGILMDPTGGNGFVSAFGFGAVFFLVVFGNLLGKSERNFFIGIRLPWTIASDDNWSATHRLTGRLMFVSGLALALLTFTSPNIAGTVLLLVLPLVAGVFYSFFYYMTRERGHEAE